MFLIKQARAWSTLQEYLNKIVSQNVKIGYEEFFRRKAFDEWGWVPGLPNYKHEEEPELDAFEEDLVNDIHDSIQFSIDCRKEKREKTRKQAELEMSKLIREGLNYEDIPDNIKCDSLRQLHLYCLIKECEDVILLADSLIQNGSKNDFNDLWNDFN